MLQKLREVGVTSEMMFMAGFASIGMSFLSWMGSKKAENAGIDRADRWGIFIGEWAPTFFTLGVALRLEENGAGMRYGRKVTKLKNAVNR